MITVFHYQYIRMIVFSCFFFLPLFVYGTVGSVWNFEGGSDLSLFLIDRAGTFGTRGVYDKLTWPGTESAGSTSGSYGGFFYVMGTGNGKGDDLWAFDTRVKLWSLLSGDPASEVEINANVGTTPGEFGPDVTPGYCQGYYSTNRCYLRPVDGSVFAMFAVQSSFNTDYVFEFSLSKKQWRHRFGSDSGTNKDLPGGNIWYYEGPEYTDLCYHGGKNTLDGNFYERMVCFRNTTGSWRLDSGGITPGGSPDIPQNKPGVVRYKGWQLENSGIFYLFSTSLIDYEQYLWKYDYFSKEYTYLSHHASPDTIVGEMNVPSPTNWPGDIESSQLFIQGTDTRAIYTYGGYYTQYFWKFDMDIDQWSCLGGMNFPIYPDGWNDEILKSSFDGTFVTPGSRYSSSGSDIRGHVSDDGVVWIFGGGAYSFDFHECDTLPPDWLPPEIVIVKHWYSPSNTLFSCDMTRNNSLLFTQCFGVYYDHPVVCSGHGRCVGNDVCACRGLYSGLTCNDLSFGCFGILPDLVDLVCSGMGECISHDECSCDGQYYGENCEHFDCFGVVSTDDFACSGNGTCNTTDSCVCDFGYTGSTCNVTVCFDLPETSEDICSTHGKCISPNLCDCDSDYIGSQCETVKIQENTTCHGLLYNDVEGGVCGRGTCWSQDNCFCTEGFFALESGGICDQWSCYGVNYDSKDVCSGRGKCTDYNTCQCNGDYGGKNCETWFCGGYDYKDRKNVCGGNGECRNPEECVCKSSYRGDKCSTNILYGALMAPLLSVAGIGMSGVVVLVICCILCCFCCGILLLMCCLCFSVYLGIRQLTGIKKFGKLRDFDIHMKEQELEQDSSLGHINFRKDLFKIDFKEIKTCGILGEGGSSSVVYKAEWKGSLAAFKCFKTRQLLSSTDSFEEFSKEVELLSSLFHPNVVRFYGASLNPPRVGILMEFCPHGELHDFVIDYRKNSENGSCCYPQKVRLVTEVAAALEFLHSRNVIHRDLKCENVLIGKGETAKLMDFGLSRLVDSMSVAKTKRIGTNIYMAPEILTDENYRESCDIFSYGILLFVVFSECKKPYGDDEFQVEFRVAKDPNYRPPINLLLKQDEQKNIINWLIKIIQRCWSHSPLDRPTMKELSETLRNAPPSEEKTNAIKYDETQGVTVLPHIESSSIATIGSIQVDKKPSPPILPSSKRRPSGRAPPPPPSQVTVPKHTEVKLNPREEKERQPPPIPGKLSKTKPRLPPPIPKTSFRKPKSKPVRTAPLIPNSHSTTTTTAKPFHKKIPPPPPPSKESRNGKRKIPPPVPNSPKNIRQPEEEEEVYYYEEEDATGYYGEDGVFYEYVYE